MASRLGEMLVKAQLITDPQLEEAINLQRELVREYVAAKGPIETIDYQIFTDYTDEVIARAREILNNLEKGELDEVGMPKIARGKKASSKDEKQLNLFADPKGVIIEELTKLDLLNMTPLEAMQRLGDWKKRLE